MQSPVRAIVLPARSTNQDNAGSLSEGLQFPSSPTCSDRGGGIMTSNHKSCMRSLIVAGVLFATCGGSESQTVFTPSFQVLVPPASFGNTVYGDAISDDGSMVVKQWFLPGSDPNCGIPGGCSRALRWTAVGGFHDLGLGGGVEAEVSDLTADGSQAVGSAG